VEAPELNRYGLWGEVGTRAFEESGRITGLAAR